MKKTIMTWASGFLTAMLLVALGVGVYAATIARTETITVTYRDIRLVVEGELVTPKDVEGNIVEPFIFDGTTFLPVRAVADALGHEVRWDPDTSTVYIGDCDLEDDDCGCP